LKEYVNMKEKEEGIGNKRGREKSGEKERKKYKKS
jgi:hypothetical protein